MTGVQFGRSRIIGNEDMPSVPFKMHDSIISMPVLIFHISALRTNNVYQSRRRIRLPVLLEGIIRLFLCLA